MIRGIGVDLVEVARVDRAVARWGERFLARVFTPEEVADARRGGDFAASLAARFAAKEAAYKAARGPMGRPLALRSIRVSAGQGRAPAIALAAGASAGKGSPAEAPGAAEPRLRWWCSLAHTCGLACAVVVVEEQPAEMGAAETGGLIGSS